MNGRRSKVSSTAWTGGIPGITNFYTGRKWGHANNYDLCINTASYGIDGTVDFILKMIDGGRK